MTFLTEARYPVVFWLNITYYLDFSSIRTGFLFRETNKLLICFLLSWPHRDQFILLLLKNSQKPLALKCIFKHHWKSWIVSEFQYSVWNYSNTSAASEIHLSRWNFKMNQNNSHSWMRIWINYWELQIVFTLVTPYLLRWWLDYIMHVSKHHSFF